MTLDNVKKLKTHLEELKNGKVKTGNATRDALIISDATRALETLRAKFPELFEKEKKKKED